MNKAEARNCLGFTIVELMVVIVIIGLIIAMGSPVYHNFQIRQNREAARHMLNSAATNLEKYYLQHGTYIESNGQWPKDLFESQVIGSTGLVYTINQIPSGQSFSIVAIPESNSIQAGDGSMCIDQQGKIAWPAKSNSCSAFPSLNCYDLQYYKGQFGGDDPMGGYQDCSAENFPPKGECPVGVYYNCNAHCEGSTILKGCSGYCKDVTIYCSIGYCSGHDKETCKYLGCGGPNPSPLCDDGH